MHYEVVYLKSLIARLEEIYRPLHESPWLKPSVWDKKINQFRYQDHGELLLIFLKGIRYLNLLNTAFVLFEKGHFQEMYILCRCMDEAFEDAQLFIKQLAENGQLSELQQKVLDEFYQEEFENYFAPAPDLVNTKRHRVPKDKIRRAIGGASEVLEKHSFFKNTVTTIHKTFSGFVHGAYPHVMELYGGDHLRYHTRGMLGTHRVEEAKDQLAVYIYRGLLVGRLAAKRLGMGNGDSQIVLLRDEMEKHYLNIATIPESYANKSGGSF